MSSDRCTPIKTACLFISLVLLGPFHVAFAQVTQGFSIGGAVGNLHADGLQIQLTYSSCLDAGMTCTGHSTNAQGPQQAGINCTLECCSNSSSNIHIVAEPDGEYDATGVCTNGVGKPLLGETKPATQSTQVISIAKGADHYAFTGMFPTGEFYTVTVVSEPTNPKQVCSVDNARGRIDMSSVTNANVECDAIFANGFE